MNVFDFVNSINKHEYIIDSINDKEYNSYIINQAFSYFPDTIFQSNQMNMHSNIDKKLQYDYFFNTIRKKSRFSKWHKKQNNSDIECIMLYYKYNRSKAKQALQCLTEEHLIQIRKKLEEGGVK